MYRFFALTWSSGSSENARAHALAGEMRGRSPAWRVVLEGPGIIVLDTGGRAGIWDAYPLRGGHGVVLGRLFRGRSEGAEANRVAITDEDTFSFVQTQGGSLSKRYWGRYVAFIRATGGTYCVLRDPTGAMPCFYHCDGGLVFVFSHIEDCRQSVGKLAAVNWRHVENYLRFSRLLGADTGIEGVESVRAGERLEVLDSECRRSFYWHPVEVCRSRMIEDPAEAAGALLAAVAHSVQAWESCYGKILHELSGGLDSAVVLACMRHAAEPYRVLALNLFTETPAGDERSFARHSARRAGCELLEAPFQCTQKSLEQMLSRDAPASPVSMTIASEAEDFRALLAHERGFQAIFSGQGGDNLFQRRRNALISAEYVQRHPFGRKLPRVLLNTAQLTGKSLWAVIGASLKHGLLRRPADPYTVFRSASFLAPRMRGPQDGHDIRHAWVEDARGLPASKQQQIFDLVDTQLYFLIPCLYADLVHPLISQRVVECALQTPTYVLTHDGRERGLARTAFADVVPSQIINRLSKGAFEGYFQDLLTRNLPFLRAYLLDGFLVREGLLIRTALEAALSEQKLLRGLELQSLIAAIQAETWLHNSLASSQRMAA
jgi:asparagine synthase (glutamine-hydrolysing)